nr:ABC transporter substrate-binding protein [Desulforamulus aquiferis]
MANQSYWGKRPKINSILFAHGTVNERINSVNSGLADIADIPAKQLAKLTKENMSKLSQPSASLGYLGMYNDRPPFNNSRIRRAICVAMDRKEIAQELFGDNSLAANSVLPPLILGYNKDLTPYSGGAQNAKELLRAAGYPNGIDITLISYTSPRPYNPIGSTLLADIVKRQLAKADIRVTIKSYPWHEFKTALNNQQGDAFLFGWVGDNMDPDNFLYTLLASGATPQTNLTKYKNSEVDRLISAAQKEHDESVRKRLYFHAQQIILQDTPMVFLNYGKDTIAVADYIKEVSLNPFGLPLFKDAYIKK